MLNGDADLQESRTRLKCTAGGESRQQGGGRLRSRKSQPQAVMAAAGTESDHKFDVHPMKLQREAAG